MRAISLAAMLTVWLPVASFGLGGPLQRPSLAHSNVDARQQKEIGELIPYMQTKLKFMEGSYINQFTFQRYGGRSAAVSDFIVRLKDVGAWQVYVQFQDFGERESAFTIEQNSYQRYLRLIINSGREDFKLRDFRAFLPKPALPEEKAVR